MWKLGSRRSNSFSTNEEQMLAGVAIHPGGCSSMAAGVWMEDEDHTAVPLAW